MLLYAPFRLTAIMGLKIQENLFKNPQTCIWRFFHKFKLCLDLKVMWWCSMRIHLFVWIFLSWGQAMAHINRYQPKSLEDLMNVVDDFALNVDESMLRKMEGANLGIQEKGHWMSSLRSFINKFIGNKEYKIIV